MQKKLSELAKLIDGEIEGDKNVLIKRAWGIKEAKNGDITFVDNERYLPLLESTSASAVLVSKKNKLTPLRGKSRLVGAYSNGPRGTAKWVNLSRKRKPLSLVYVENPSLAFSKIVSLFAPEVSKPQGIHPAALIGKNVRLGRDVAIQAYTVIEDNVQIGARTIIHSGVYIGQESCIGKDCLIYSNVSIRERTKIGNRVIIQSGAVIGSDGFGFSTEKGVHHKIPQLGSVEIGDDVEIGANVTIDRARFERTYIGKGTKIDNLVQIGHNVTIGENAIIVAQTGISGSTRIGKNVTLAGQVGIAGHISIGDNVVVAAKAGVTKSIPEGSFVSGFPAKAHTQEKKIKACIQRLPKLFEKVKELEKKIERRNSKSQIPNLK
ncbi:MAG: UDP-3-O-(3-hydroxymyristoyl)glucosamine N-acyltransferase [Candidatus Omnitrophica bacterium]|nr:UDP-3-O-(3-hydroxymyristoyl)glucosamine N-acyltransferase [Candidatus Omnitrophota bacterium]